MKKEPTVMAMFVDDGGICQAWATGPAHSEDEVKQTASTKLAQYRADHPALQDAAFRLKVVTLESIPKEKEVPE